MSFHRRYFQTRIEALKRRVLTSWKAYQGRSHPSPSSMDPADVFQSFKGNQGSHSQARRHSTQDLSVEDSERRRNNQLKGFVNKSNEKGFKMEEKVLPGYRRSSMV